MSFKSTINQQHDLCQRMQRGELVLCISDRQKKWCIQTWAGSVVDRNQESTSVFVRPQVFTLYEWLWQAVIAKSDFHKTNEATRAWAWNKAYSEFSREMLAFPLATARRFADACEDWQVPMEDKFWNYEGADLYRRWYLEGRAKLDDVKGINDNQLIAKLIANPPIPSGKSLILVGLLSTNVLFENLFKSWQQAGVALHRWEPRPASVQDYVLVDTQASNDAQLKVIAKVAHKAHQLSGQGERVLVVVPNLVSCWLEVFDTFRREFSPQLDLHSALLDRQREVNFSGGMMLARQPVVAAALGLLRLHRESSMQQVMVLLHNQIIDCDLKLDKRKKLSNWIAQRAATTTISNWDGSSKAKNLPREYQQWKWLERLNAILKSAPAVAMPSKWANKFYNQLGKCGWLHRPSEHSWDYQLLKSFTEQLEELARLDRLGESLSRKEAVDLFAQLLEGKLFQPVPPNVDLNAAPVQVLDTFAAIGLRFDHTFICGFDSDTFFRQQQQNYPLPPAVQRERCMPGSSPQQVIDDSFALWKSLLTTAPRFSLYHASMVGEVIVQSNPYSLVAARIEAAIEQTLTPQQFDAKYTLEVLEDAQPVANPKLTAGSIAAQSQCGWRGWWTIAKVEMDELEPQLYPSAQWRGKVIHHAFANIMRSDFAQLQQHLSQLKHSNDSQQIVKDRVAKSVHDAIRRYRQDAPMLDDKTTEVYLDYLTQVILVWLAKYELETNPIAVEHVVEQVEIGGLIAQKLFIDRVDEYQGQALVIDYKTGNPSINELFDLRIPEPQLLIYAKALRQQNKHKKVCGLGYAKVMPVRQAYQRVKGTAAIKPAYKAKFLSDEEWQQTLEEALARLDSRTALYNDGRVMLDPICPQIGYKQDACSYCSLKASCRVAEAQVAVSA